MAINPNEKLLNNHCAFIGGSGSGKTFKVKKTMAREKKARVMIFDTQEVYEGIEYHQTMVELAKAVMTAQESGKPFVFGYSGKESDFNSWCRLCWIIADGSRPLFTVFEECGGYLGNGASTDDWWYKLITVGRKYNVRVLPVSQRPQNMSKVLFDNCNRKWIGFSKGKAREYLEREFKIDLSLIKPESYAYYFDDVKGVNLFDKNDKKVKV